MKKARTAISQTGESVRASTGRGSVRRDTKNGWVMLGALAGAFIEDLRQKRKE